MPDATGTSQWDHPQVSEIPGGKALFFNAAHVQSEMSLARPNALEFEYTQLMMGFLLWLPHPATLCMVGLGGGSMVKFCYHHLPSAHTTVLEINPGVIALRNAFQIPPDDARLQVVCADAADYLAHTERRFDALLVDGFDAQGLPAALSTPQFYADCAGALSEAGVAVFNLHRCDKLFDVVCDRIAAAFEGAVCFVNDSSASNCVAFACKGVRTPLALASVRRATALEASAWRELQPLMLRVLTAR